MLTLDRHYEGLPVVSLLPPSAVDVLAPPSPVISEGDLECTTGLRRRAIGRVKVPFVYQPQLQVPPSIAPIPIDMASLRATIADVVRDVLGGSLLHTSHEDNNRVVIASSQPPGLFGQHAAATRVFDNEIKNKLGFFR